MCCRTPGRRIANGPCSAAFTLRRSALFLAALAVSAAGAPCTGNSAHLPPLQCGAWQDLFDSLQGPRWAHCNSTRNDPCACNNQWPAPYVTCNSAGIAYIYRPGSDSPAGKAVGTIPDSIGQLTALNYLVLGDNVWGTLPASFGKLHKLTQLFFDTPYLGGAIPPGIPFSQLTWCSLIGGGSRFACPLPQGALNAPCSMEPSACGSPCTGNSTKLAVDQCLAWISFYDATGGKDWGYCRAARTDPCSCQGNNDGGPVCSDDGTFVKYVYLPIGTLEGYLPESIGAWVNITGFWVYDNLLHGTLPLSMAAWQQIAHFNVMSNQLEGAVPQLPFLATCTENANMDCAGNDMFGFAFVLDTAAECCAKCQATPGCNAWTWNAKTNRYCYVKTGCPNPSSSGGIVAGWRATLAGCILLDHAQNGTNSFDCPWPTGATDH